MKYNLANQSESQRAAEYLTTLQEKQAIVEIKKVSPRRSLNQNAFLHLLLSAFGAHFGYSNVESKTIYKREVNPDIYIYEKNGQKFLRSSADLTKEEMMKSIDRFREYSSEQDYPLPTANDVSWIRELENSIEATQFYL